MLDSRCAFTRIPDENIDIYWGAYLGTADEITITGRLTEVAEEVQRVRTEAADRKGWIMDTYLLRRADPPTR
jgi:precorrin-6A synthase